VRPAVRARVRALENIAEQRGDTLGSKRDFAIGLKQGEREKAGYEVRTLFTSRRPGVPLRELWRKKGYWTQENH